MNKKLLFILPRRVLILLLVIPAFIPHSFAQCTNWNISAGLIAGSTCAANGNFAVTLTGPDATNLTNIQYGIPLGANGFSVPLNNSSTFYNMPPGSFTVSVVATCAGNPVGRNTTITIPGSYVPPTATFGQGRASLDCAYTGTLSANISHGRAPYLLTLTNVPSGYSGAANYPFSGSGISIPNLPAGSYSAQITDACGSGVTPQTAVISALDPSTIPFVLYEPVASSSCNIVSITRPVITPNNNTAWAGYDYDTTFKFSMQVPGVINSTPFTHVNSGAVTVQLNAGKTYKDLYGKQVTYTIHPPCGADFPLTSAVAYPYVNNTIDQNCNIDFTGTLTFSGLICFPVTYSYTNTATGATYGPFTTNTSTANIPSLPVAMYTLNYTTADGYTASGSVGTTPISGTPYSVSVLNGASGLNNYIEGFVFNTTSNVSVKTIELFSGPAGYSAVNTWYGNSPTIVTDNQTPAAPGTLKFPAGNYVWKITDKCGTYFLPITVGASDLYQFTAGIDHQQQTCQGLWVTPAVTSTRNGVSQPVTFSLLKNGNLYTANSGSWQQYPAGDSVLITDPGVYTIVNSSAPYTFYFSPYLYSYIIPYPNTYTRSYTFTYSINPVQADINKTQGFLCKGATPGQAEIYVKGKNGIPFAAPQDYHYYLAHQGNGVSGPYIADNMTGIFTGFGGNANDVYDLKIADSCGAFAIQTVTILDLQTARLISSNHYVACNAGSVQLSAIYLPNATYVWTGPNGFTSTDRTPLITNAGPQNAGVYHVTITSTNCSIPITDSTTLAINTLPPRPQITIACGPPVVMTITNPTAGYKYTWQMGVTVGNTYYQIPNLPSGPGYTYLPPLQGGYEAVATDTVTGCSAYSDSLYLANDQGDTLAASIYAPHLKICPGDTATLVAQGAINIVNCQWFLNGVAIPGATSYVYTTTTPGNYKVYIDAGLCMTDTSDEVTVILTPAPTASITGTGHDICAGQALQLLANTGTGYSYTWSINDTTIPGNSSATLAAVMPGNYKVTVSNGGCVATSTPYNIIVHAPPVANLSPSGNLGLCNGSSIQFSTPAGTDYTYTWLYNNTTVSGATNNTYSTSQPGTYQVIVNNTYCPGASSQQVIVTLLPVSVHLPNDTFVCQPGPFAITLTAGSGFTQTLWSTGETGTQITATTSGTYWVQATNSCGIYSDTVHIGSINDYTFNLPADTLICNDHNIATFSVPAILQQVHWSTGATTASISVTQPGTYWVEASTPCGTRSDTVVVHFCTPEIQGITLPDKSICAGDCIQPTAQVSNYPQYYHWYLPGGDPATSQLAVPGTVCYSKAGTYPVKLVVQNAGGIDSFISQLTVMPKPVPRFKDTAITVPYKTNVTLPACAAAQTIDWYKNGELICANCPSLVIDDARYFLSKYHCIVSNNDCKDSCTYELQVIDIPHDVWMPDAFTPNNDGRNDIFRIITDNPNVLVITLSVFDRWGERVFVSNMNNDGWDGTIHGRQADMGTYFWMLRYKILGSGDEVYEKKGDVTVVR